jgi:sulfoxide reductase catalytic subunit YedY
MEQIDPLEVTPKRLYLSRKQFIGISGATIAGALALAACQGALPTTGTVPPFYTGPTTDELGDPLTPLEDITHYNNYYEFSTSKTAVADLVTNFPISPWSVEVSGLVDKPKTYTVDDLQSFSPETRVYRMRCVEAWSMVIPWIGFPLNRLLADVQPTSQATFVKFTAIYDPKDMPLQSSNFLPWPYYEGLRMDEAMNNLTLLVTGMYGEDLPKQDGAPVRLVVPWKYGYKSIKAIVKIELVDFQPATLWDIAEPTVYGFYANVNPNVSRTPWSQATERRIGEVGRINTLLFNGYGKEVASLYTGMDLSKDF